MCAWIKMPGGGYAIVCGRGHRHELRYCRCGEPATLQCDHPEPARDRFKGGKRTKTCDAWICEACAQEIGPDRHLCPAHQRQGRLAL
jgi:hypothetical protein